MQAQRDITGIAVLILNLGARWHPRIGFGTCPASCAIGTGSLLGGGGGERGGGGGFKTPPHYAGV